MNYSTVYACRVCKSRDLRTVFSLGEHRLNGFLHPDDSPRPTVPLTFVWCSGCHCLQQKHSVNPEILHQGRYWYRSGVSDTMKKALADVVSAAGQKVKLEDKDVVLDIGSNDGTLLRLYGRHLIRIGVEPMAESLPGSNHGISLLLNNAWGDSTALHAYRSAVGSKKAKIITALGMLYSVENPDNFIRDVAAVLHEEGVFVAQLMTLPDMLESGDVGNLCHEHLTFPSLTCLCRLFAKYGLHIYWVEKNSVNGGSTRVYAHRASSTNLDIRDEEKTLLQSTQAFANQAKENLNHATRLVYEQLKNSENVCVYGASTKGNTILQCMGLTYKHILRAADRDVNKWGLVMSAGSIPIVSEEEAVKLATVFLVLPYAFREEIIARLKSFGWSGKLIFPLPQAEVVDV